MILRSPRYGKQNTVLNSVYDTEQLLLLFPFSLLSFRWYPCPPFHHLRLLPASSSSHMDQSMYFCMVDLHLKVGTISIERCNSFPVCFSMSCNLEPVLYSKVVVSKLLHNVPGIPPSIPKRICSSNTFVVWFTIFNFSITVFENVRIIEWVKLNIPRAWRTVSNRS